MATRVLDKFVAVSLLEATKSALDHMGRWRMESSHRGEKADAHLASTYGSVRRLRDYIQSLLYAGAREVSWEINEDDENLLVSCAGHYLRELESSEAEPATLKLKQGDFIAQCVEMATRELADLPAPRVGGMKSRGYQELRTGVLEKLRGSVKEPAIVWRGETDGPAPAGGGVVAAEVSAAPAAPALPPAVPEAPSAPEAPATPRARRAPRAPVAPAGRQTGEPPVLLNVRVIRDPQLRSIATLDQRALIRAMRARDLRLISVHLLSILEAAMLDYMLGRRRELGLSGPPEPWDLQALVLKLLGEDIPDGERLALESVCGAGALISPFKQLVRPMVVTPGNSKLQVDVVKKALVKLGYRGSGGAMARPRESTG